MGPPISGEDQAMSGESCAIPGKEWHCLLGPLFEMIGCLVNLLCLRSFRALGV
jgi:hypothetical protein